ncbi:MAG: Hint domain-containing protein, partial [Thermoplasmata archaeon]
TSSEISPGSGTFAHPDCTLRWLTGGFYFRLEFSTTNERNKWIRILTQSNSTPLPSSSGIIYNTSSYIGLGRAKLVIPGNQYFCRINYIYASNTDNYLLIYPDTSELPVFPDDTTFCELEYFISIAPYQHGSSLPNIFIHNADDLSYPSRPLFRNGWDYMHTANILPNFENGVFSFMAPSIKAYNYLTPSLLTFNITVSSAHTLVDIAVYVETPFNGTGNNTIDVGLSGSPEYWINNLDVSTRGWKAFTYENPPQPLPAGTVYTARYNGTGATQGRVYVYFYYYTSSIAGKCLWEQRIRKQMVYPGQAITFSCFLARDAILSLVGTYGTFSFYVVPMPYYIFDGYFSMPSTNIASISLAECRNRGIDGKLQYEYVVLYGNIPTNYNWDNIKYVRFGVIAEWGQNDGKYNYIMTKPMLNIGNEAAPYTNKNQVDRLTMYPPSEYIPNQEPPNHEEDDPMCIEENQMILCGDGEYKMAKDIKERDVLKGFKYNNIVQNIEKAERNCVKIIFEDDNGIIVSETHNCFIGENQWEFEIIKASCVKIGDKMYNIAKGKMVKVINVINVGKKIVYKISTNYPHHIIVNNILTHNVKAGGGEY